MNILSRKQKLKSGDTTWCHGKQPGNFHNILARNILARNVLEMKILAMNILSRKQKLKSGDTTRCHGKQPGQFLSIFWQQIFWKLILWQEVFWLWIFCHESGETIWCHSKQPEQWFPSEIGFQSKNIPDICLFFSTSTIFGSTFLHTKASKLRQNRYRDKTA